MPGLQEFRRTLKLHRAQLFGLTEVRAMRKVRTLYGEAFADTQDNLRALVRAGKGQTFRAHHYRQVMAHRHLVREIKVLSKTFEGHTPVLKAEQAQVALGLWRRHEPSLMRRYAASSTLYGRPTMRKVERQMAMAMVRSESLGDAVDRVQAAILGERWRAERIARTEMAYSYGVIKQASLENVRQDLPRLMKRLVATHDDRTGEDSIELDGQTVPVDQPFIWNVKDSKGTPTGRVERYMQPPNRPNDREVVIPWDPAWGSSIGGNAGPVAPSTVSV